MQPKKGKTMFTGFMLNRKERDEAKEKLTSKMDELSKYVFKNISDLDRIVYVNPRGMDLKEVGNNYSQLKPVCNGIQQMDWYHRFLSNCPDEVDMPPITTN